MVLLPERIILEKIGQMAVDPKEEGFVQVMRAMPGYSRGQKGRQDKPKDAVAEAYAKLRHKDNRMRKGVKRKIRTLIKKQKTKEVAETN